MGSLNFQEFQWMEVWLFGALLGGLLWHQAAVDKVVMVLVLVHFGLAICGLSNCPVCLGP